jgi:hypothetical protein
MGTSFPLIQKAVATGTDSITFGDPVSYGNLLVVAIGYNTASDGAALPGGVADGLGNYYKFYSASGAAIVNGARNRNDSFMTALYVAQGTSATTYGGIVGGNCTITFTGMPALWSARPGLPIIFAAEFEVPDYYNVFATQCVDEALAGEASCNISFRSIVANGVAGGANCSDTGNIHLGFTIVGSPTGTNHSPSAVALVNQPLDVTIVAIDYNDAGNSQTGWTSTGTLMETAQAGAGSGGATWAAWAFQDFPYLNGPLVAQCGNPPPGTVGTAYGPMGAGYSLLVSGGTSPYTWTIIGGALPPGLSLTGSGASAGLITGTPTTAGQWVFTAQVTDSLGATYPITCTITVCPASGPPSAASNYGWTG